jgi:hypothetical protein
LEPISSINKILSIVMQEERQQNYGLHTQTNEESNILVNAIEDHGSGRGFVRGRGYFFLFPF